MSQKSPRVLTPSLLTAEVSINLYKCTLKRTNLIISDLKITPAEYAKADEKVSSVAGIDSSSEGKKNHEMN